MILDSNAQILEIAEGSIFRCSTIKKEAEKNQTSILKSFEAKCEKLF
jgi:hypothetical protein